ncbi:unnamed protein product [Pleuronectes platessa]|uniref:Uncharacterized protein n=1 Tax=Pleuronectes platessa TaxID=8262 RepID=A0A9N7UBK6_PLEPL|nr:unnamed protein product [Pleuronectes platessa]
MREIVSNGRVVSRTPDAPTVALATSPGNNKQEPHITVFRPHIWTAPAHVPRSPVDVWTCGRVDVLTRFPPPEAGAVDGHCLVQTTQTRQVPRPCSAHEEFLALSSQRPRQALLASVEPPTPATDKPQWRTRHRCWDACLCIAIVRKCHCWHLTAAGEPTRACLLATCSPASSATDTGSLVFSAVIPRLSPPRPGRLAGPGPVKINQDGFKETEKSLVDVSVPPSLPPSFPPSLARPLPTQRWFCRGEQRGRPGALVPHMKTASLQSKAGRIDAAPVRYTDDKDVYY